MGAPVAKPSLLKQSFVTSHQPENELSHKKIVKSIIIKGHSKMETLQSSVQIKSFFSAIVEDNQKILSNQNLKVQNGDEIKGDKNKSKENTEYLSCNNEDANSKKGFLTDRSDNVPNEESHNLLASSFSSLKMNFNGDFQAKLFSLPDEVFFVILQFLIDEYFELIRINSLWFLKIKENLETSLLQLDNSFIKEHLSFFQLRNGYNSTKILHNKKSKLGFRFDRNLVAELLPGFEKKTIIFKFSYRMINRTEEYCTEFALDVSANDKKKIWIYKEDLQLNCDAKKYAFIQTIPPIRAGHNIKFALTIYNLKGLIDINSIKWMQPIVEEIPFIPKKITPEAINHLNMDRICELETLFHDWISYDYYDGKTINFDLFSPQLILKKVKFCGYDMLALKIVYLANCAGFIKDSLNFFGTNIELFCKNFETTTEIKRKGLFFDLENRVELNIGDKLIFYLSKIK